MLKQRLREREVRLRRLTDNIVDTVLPRLSLVIDNREMR